MMSLGDIARRLNRSRLGIANRLQKFLSTEERREIILKERRKKRMKDWDNPEVRKQHDHEWYLQHKKEVLSRGREYQIRRSQKYEEYKKRRNVRNVRIMIIELSCFIILEKRKEKLVT